MGVVSCTTCTYLYLSLQSFHCAIPYFVLKKISQIKEKACNVHKEDNAEKKNTFDFTIYLSWIVCKESRKLPISISKSKCSHSIHDKLQIPKLKCNALL